MLFYLFTKHHILPGNYYNLSEGEKVIIRAFFEKEMELKQL